MRFIQVFILSVTITGCAHKIQPSTDKYEIGPITEFTAPADISVINTQTDNVDHIHFSAGGSTFSGNMQSWTETAIEITKQELIAREARILNMAQRKLELSIVAIELEYKSKFAYTTKLKVKTGSAYVCTYIGVHASRHAAGWVAGGAVMQAVTAMFRDPVIINYITSSKAPLKYEYAPWINPSAPYESLRKLQVLFNEGNLTEDQYIQKKREVIKYIKCNR